MSKVINRTEIGVNHLACAQDFPFESLTHVRIDRVLRENRLQRHVDPAQLKIFYLVHLAHPAPGDESNDHEAAVDKVAWFELRNAGRRS
jgi:hypothetical protein